MRRVWTVLVLVVIALIPVGVYLLRSGTDGRTLRVTIGRCSSAQRSAHRNACAYIDGNPTIELIGPIDETGTPFTYAPHRAGDGRRVEERLDSGSYTVLLKIDRFQTIRASQRSPVDLTTGSRDIGTITPAEPWELTGVPGA
jgi:hypothetical protein